MCKFASFLYNINTLEPAVYNLLSHSDTQEHLNLQDTLTSPWREGHYLPTGEIEIRTLSSDPDLRYVAHFRERFPTFADFFQWALNNGASLEQRDEYGDTVAHLAARSGFLPADFAHWEWRNKWGETVAHFAAYGGFLPADFKHWEWRNKWGETVAHLAAEYGHLPADFVRWDLVSEQYRRIEPKVTCALCGQRVSSVTAHLHQNDWIGDECCWDERLRASE